LSDLLNKNRKKNSLTSDHEEIKPKNAFDRQRLFSGKEVTKKKKGDSTATRIDRSVLKDLKALKTLDDASSISEVIQSMIYLRENQMSDDQRREYELIKSILK
jgi:hypothetical protein